MKAKLLNALVIALMLLQAVAPIGALAAVSTNQYIYYGGDVVYISGNEMQAEEMVFVDVFFPDGSLSQHHEVTADSVGNFTDTYVVPIDGPSGDYTVISTGQTSGSTFTTTFDPPPCNVTASISSPVSGDTFTAASVGGTASVTFAWSTSGAVLYAASAKVDGAEISTAATSSTSLSLTAGVHSLQVKATPSVQCTGGIAVANVTITVNDPVVANHTPVANADSYSTNEDTALTVAAPGVLGNDADADSNPLTAAVVDPPTHGSVTLNADGSFTYTPNANYNGSDSFTYQAYDGTDYSNTATVTLDVTAVNDAPVAANDSYNTDEDTPLHVLAADGVLVNDTDTEGSSLTAALVDNASHGSVTLNADGSFTYTPDANFNGPDSFTYQAYDGTDYSTTATVSISVSAVNDAPIANNDSYSTNEDTALNAPVMSNDTDVDGDTLTASVVSGPANGTLTPNLDGSFTYTPNANFNGSDSFTYKVNDGNVDSNVATVSIAVIAVNDAPVLDPIGNQAVNEETALTFASTASDVDNAVTDLTFSLVGAPAGASITSDGSFSWTPTEEEGPSDYPFTVKVCDNGTPSLCDEEAISVHVDEVNVAPVLNAIGDKSVNEETLLSFTATASDHDVPVQTLTFSLSGEPSGASITSGGDFSWTPTEAQGPGTYTFDVCVSDGALSDCETIEVTVAEVNLAPVLDPIGNQTVDEETILNFTASATDADLPANTLTFSLVGAPGGASITSGGVFSWTPTEEQGPGSYTFDVCVSDGALSDCETITVTVKEVNLAPVLTTIGNKSVNEGATLSFTASATDADIPANTLSFSLVSAPAGAAIDPSTGAFSWTPADNGTSTFTVKVCDNGSPAKCDEETITVTVNNVKPNVSALTVGGGSGTACLAGNAVTLDFSFSDPGVNDKPWVVDIDWGDDSTHTTYNTNSQGAQPQQSHTYGAGSFQISVKVTDKDGGVGNSTGTNTVSHLYNMSGILAPFNPDGTSVWKYGSTLPVKVKITDCNGIPVPGLAPKIGTSLVSTNDPQFTIDEATSTSAADTGNTMRYDPTGGQYIYNYYSKTLSDGSASYYMYVKGTDTNGNVVTSLGIVQVKFGLKLK